MSIMDGIRSGYDTAKALAGDPSTLKKKSMDMFDGLSQRIKSTFPPAPGTGEAAAAASAPSGPAGPAGPAPSGPAPSGPAPSGPAGPAVEPVAKGGIRGASGLMGKVNVLGTLAGGVNGAVQGYRESQALDNTPDRVALAGERAARFAGAEAGAVGGAKLGARGGLVGSTVGGLVGGGLGYVAPDIVKKITDFSGLTDASTLLPSEKADNIISAQEAQAAQAARTTQAIPPSVKAARTTQASLDGLRSQPAGSQYFAAGSTGARQGSNELDNGLRTLPAAGTGIMRDSSGNIVRFSPTSDAGSAPPAQVFRTRPVASAPDPVAEATARAIAAQKGGNLDDIIATRLGLRTELKNQDTNAELKRAAFEASTQQAASRDNRDVSLAKTAAEQTKAAAASAEQAQASSLSQANRNQDFALRESDANRSAREGGQKALNDQLSTIFTTKDAKGQDVPDVARVADASRKIQDELGARVQDALKVPASDKNYAQAQQLAAAIKAKGVAALEPDDINELLSQVAIRDRVNQTAGFGGSSPVDSRLSGYSLQSSSPNLIGSDTLTLRNNSRVRANDVRYTEPANSIFWDWGHTPTDLFRAGLRAKK